jgi:hypothetical protein
MSDCGGCAMFRLRIALGVASSLVAVAALTIVFAGTGEAQGNGQLGPNVVVVNTPLPVTGNVIATIPGGVNVTGNVTATVPGTVNVAGDVTATVTGSVNAAVTGDVNATVAGQVTVDNPSTNPVLIRDVDRQGAKVLWQMNKNIEIPDGTTFGSISFGPVPAGKALVVEHVNFLFQNPTNLAQAVYNFSINNTSSFSAPAPSDIQYFAAHPIGFGFTADVSTKFYVAAGRNLNVGMLRVSNTGTAFATATITGYLIDYP